MPWWTLGLGGRHRVPADDLSAAYSRALTAAAAPVTAPQSTLLRNTDAWQEEAWRYYDTLGEYNYAVSWLSAMLSRVRLYAAELVPGQDEPVRLEDGPAVEIMNKLSGGVSGQTEMMASLAVQLAVPGEGYVIGEVRAGAETWSVRSTDEVQARHGLFEVKDELAVNGDVWRPVVNGHVFRVWRPHKRWYHLADSSSRAARSTMRELELVNRHILAQYLSRLASAGVVLFPTEVMFPVREEFAEAEDPFMAEWVELARAAIAEPGTASAVVPLPMRMPGEWIDKVKYLDFTLKIDEKIIEKRDSAIKRLATQVNIPAEVLLGMGDVNHWCTLDHVRIMTRAGWKTYDQLTVGEDVLTLNHETGLSEWQPVQIVNTWDVTDEAVITITGRRHSSTTTLNHRWPVLSGTARKRERSWITTGELVGQFRSSAPSTQQHEYFVLGAPNAELPTEPKYSDALVELVAWYFTEGSSGIRPGRRTPKVVIYQSHEVNPENCSRIRRALTALYGPVSTALDKGGRYASPESVARRARTREVRAENPKMSLREIGEQVGVSAAMVHKYLRNDARTRDDTPRWRERIDGGMTHFVLNSAAAETILEHAPGRVVPVSFVQQLTLAQLNLFIDAAVRGDGHLMHGVTPVFGQKDPLMCDAFELACILSGRSVNRYAHTSEGRSANGPRMKTQHMVTASDRSLTFAPRGRSFEEHSYTGTIWCPTTPNGSWLAEDRGHVFFTGNSGWQIEEGALKTTIAPEAELISRAVTTGYLQPRLKASGEDDPSRFVVWYDMSELTMRPDKSDDAIQLYDRLELSGDALRREGGFDESDKPTDDDLRDQALKVIIKTLPSGAASALSQLIGEEVAPVIPVSPQSPEVAEAVEAGEPVPQPVPDGPPNDGEAPSEPDDGAVTARAQRMTQQAHALHAVRFTMGHRWELLHPSVCEKHAYSCPYTQAVLSMKVVAHPGRSGLYECALDTFGRLRVGDAAPQRDVTRFLATHGGGPR